MLECRKRGLPNLGFPHSSRANTVPVLFHFFAWTVRNTEKNAQEETGNTDASILFGTHIPLDVVKPATKDFKTKHAPDSSDVQDRKAEASLEFNRSQRSLFRRMKSRSTCFKRRKRDHSNGIGHKKRDPTTRQIRLERSSRCCENH